MNLIVGALRDMIEEITFSARDAWSDEAVRTTAIIFAGVVVLVTTVFVVTEILKAHAWSAGAGILGVSAAVVTELLVALFCRALYRRWRGEHKRKNDECM